MNETRSGMRRRACACLVVCVLCVLALGGAQAAPLGTAFTYSGRLKYQNQPANGSFDLQVKLYDDATAGNQVGPTVSVNTLNLANGLFVTSLDFGSGVFNGTAYWLDIAARPSGNGPFTALSPRQPVNPAPHALYAPTAGIANTAAANSIDGASIQNNAVRAANIASGQVVKSLNGLTDTVTLQAGANVSLTPSGNTLTIAASGGGGGSGWSLTGNAGITPGLNFLGTTDNHPLELRAFGGRGLSLESVSRGDLFSSEDSMNLVGGFGQNAIASGALGGTVAGGGGSAFAAGMFFSFPNQVTGDYGTVGGGSDNTAGPSATVPGGSGNLAGGLYSLAAGHRAKTSVNGSFVWADSQNADFWSVRPNEIALRAAGGLYLQSDAGIRLNAANTPLITRVWDPFNAGTGAKEAHGRWGMFMEPFNLVLGIPDTDVPGGERSCAIWKYRPDGNASALFTIRNTDAAAWFAGDVSVKTLTIRGGADLAEPFDMSGGELPEGSVVVIDERRTGRLKLSTQPYDTRVAGIVSGANGIHPGISLQQEGVNGNGQPVALSGRVYVRAEADAGAIQPGDLLTTSAVAGHAMKVTDPARAHGAILGKAMSALPQGRGMVLVLVTLQ